MSGAPGADGEGGGIRGVGAIAWWGWAGAIVRGREQPWGCLQPRRTALHTISISLQNSLS